MSNSRVRNTSLDVLRAVAVFLVMGRHAVICPEEVSPVLHKITSMLVTGGWIGVDLFFVLSGFLVSGILFREQQKHGSLDIKRFFIRRGLKIYPAFWLFFLVSIIVKMPDNRSEVLGEILFLQNYMGSLWLHTWSLAVEEHFYIFLGLLLVLLMRLKSPKGSFSSIPYIFLSVAIGCLLLRFVVMVTEPFTYQTHVFASHIRMDALMFGVLLSWLWHFGDLAESLRNPTAQTLYCIAGILLFVPAFIFPLNTTPWIPVVGLTLFYLGAGALMLGLLHAKINQSNLFRILAQVGTYSYSIYLWHQPVNEWLQAGFTAWMGTSFNWYLYVLAYAVGSLVIGVLTAKMVEYPVLKLRDRIYPSRSEHFSTIRKEVIPAEVSSSAPQAQLQ